MFILKKFVSFIIIVFLTSTSVAQENEIIFAISPMASPVSTLSNYGKFMKYLSDKTGSKIVLKQRRKYSEINSLLKSGVTQFAYTCTGAYLSGRSEFGLELLAVPVVKGRTSYNSYIIVRKESKIDNFDQLRGKIFAFTDPLSLSGRLYPLYLLSNLKEKPEDFFEKTFYTSSHEKSIESVAYGFADGAAVDSLIFDDMKRMEDLAVERVRIIKISPPYGIPPIVVSPYTDNSKKQIVLKTLLKMAQNTTGRKILAQIGIEKFILPNPEIYHDAALLRKTIFVQ